MPHPCGRLRSMQGLALGGIYNHFSSKEEIFEAIIIDQHPYKKILPLILAVEGETGEEFFGNAFRIVIKSWASNRNLST